MKTYYITIDTPIGWMLAVSDGKTLTSMNLPKPTRELALAEAPIDGIESAQPFGDLAERLRLYFDGERVDFSDLPVSFDGLGPFEVRVLRETMALPHGSITSYGALAATVGSPSAARAVGNTMRKNPLPIVVPCHRVLHADGGLGGYAGGLDIKRRLLALEGVAL